MGYTHYWELLSSVDETAWARICDAAKRILSEATSMGIPLQWESDVDAMPEVSTEMIRFNGVEEDGHETFLVTPNPKWDFCKTARKPYDTVVVAMLCMLEQLAEFSWSSDGDKRDHLAGKQLWGKVRQQMDLGVAA